MRNVTSIQGHLFSKIYKSLDEIEKVLDRMGGSVKELEEKEKAEEKALLASEYPEAKVGKAILRVIK